MTATATTPTAEDREYAHEVATTIRLQVSTPIFWSLGGSDYTALIDATTGDPGLAFKARILPFTKSGDRSTSARAMDVRITLNGSDYYDVAVTYRGRDGAVVTHFQEGDVDCVRLPRVMLALDYDGPTALNPRYASAVGEE